MSRLTVEEYEIGDRCPVNAFASDGVIYASSDGARMLVDRHYPGGGYLICEWCATAYILPERGAVACPKCGGPPPRWPT
jgi:hypothetical protein